MAGCCDRVHSAIHHQPDHTSGLDQRFSGPGHRQRPKHRYQSCRRNADILPIKAVSQRLILEKVCGLSHIAGMNPLTLLPARTAFCHDRRTFLKRLSASAALFTVPGAFAEELLRTPRQTEGPFYPDHLPLDTDNDLIIVNDALTPAVGEITHLNGRILDARGQPIRNALVEIWQVDNNGVYLHSNDTHAERDRNFQGFGRFLTGSGGEYYFRTIKPVAYPGPTRHIHFAIKP